MTRHRAKNIILMTGITSGMGREAAKILLDNPSVHVITGIRNPDRKVALAELPADRLTVFPLEMASLKSVKNFCNSVKEHLQQEKLTSLGLNAGIQITSGLKHSVDGIEKTFAINHLAHWLIAEELKDNCIENAQIVVTASGTHNPNDPVAKRFGFRGGIFPSAEKVAQGMLDSDAKPAQQCLDRYATSKMANVMHVLAKAGTDNKRTWLAYDPGLMPGTALARDRSAIEKFAWNNVMPVMRHFMKGVSTSKLSGKFLSQLLLGQKTYPSGSYVEYTGEQLSPWEKTSDETVQDDLMKTSATLAASVMA